MAQLTATRSELLARRARISLLSQRLKRIDPSLIERYGHGRTAEGAAGV